MSGISIAVVTMNKPRVLQQTLQALLENTFGTHEIIIVDNGSTDQEQLKVLEWAESFAKVVRNASNLGLSTATNQGLELGQYETLVHMDDDCVVRTRGWDTIMSEYFSNYPKIGMLVPMASGEYLQEDGYQQIRWGLGMFWGIRKSLFDTIGGYDPQLVHQNECDMALRVRMSGYHVAQTTRFGVFHNDPGGPKSDVAAAREHIGCVQFRDKWCSYFRGPEWNYGTQPLYLMQHWPPDQEWYRRYALQHGLNLNPLPEEFERGENNQGNWEMLDTLADRQKVMINGQWYLVWRSLQNDYAHWEWQYNPDGYINDRAFAIQRWAELTGETYDGYKWPDQLLRPY